MMVQSKSGKIVFSIKKENFRRGKFDDATFELGNFIWSLSSNNRNPILGKTASLKVCFNLKVTTECTMVSCLDASGVVYLEGLDGRFNAMKAWSIYRPDVQLKVGNSIFSFDEKYLFPDGTYRIGLNVMQESCLVDFTSPDHALILGTSDAGCLQIEETKVYVSKSFFAAQSPYFKALFYGDFKEKTEDVIVLNDVKFGTFKEFILHLYTELDSVEVRRPAIPELLALADMFLCNTVTRSCETTLVERGSFTVADLELAEKYRLGRLRFMALSLLPVADLRTYLAQIADTPDSLYTRHFIFDRIEEEALR